MTDLSQKLVDAREKIRELKTRIENLEYDLRCAEEAEEYQANRIVEIVFKMRKFEEALHWIWAIVYRYHSPDGMTHGQPTPYSSVIKVRQILTAVGLPAPEKN